MCDEFNKLNIVDSQISHIPLLFKSACSGFNTNGQSSSEQTQNCCLNMFTFILSADIEQSLFS
jgi:hypothetical protein